MQEKQGFIIGHGGLRLFYRTWEPEQPRGSVLLVHGTNEHMGRYEHVAAFFVQQGMAVYALDQRGYGKSEGLACYVDRFEDYLQDLRLFADMAQAHGKPVMIGHSLGGLIAYRYALAYPNTIAGLVLSSPMLIVRAGGGRLKKALAPLIARIFPRLKLPANIPAEHVTLDPEVARKYAADPLVWKTVTPRWFMECTRVAREAMRGEAGELKVPALFLQAGDDRLVDPEGARTLYGLVPHERKGFKLYPGKYHEIFNDPGREDVFADILAWMREQDLIPS